ncbi:MAG: CD225/dispanin family protein [Flavobacteriaceae bacterium]
MEQNQPRPQNYLAVAIIGTLLCCIPGIVSIVYAAKVNGLYADGKHQEAASASKNAKTWGIVAIVLGALSWIIQFIFGLSMFALAGSGDF